jgi:hypothetical protein
MSDTSQGEGWWLASDGRWYPPEAHPNYGSPPPPPPPATHVGGVPADMVRESLGLLKDIVKSLQAASTYFTKVWAGAGSALSPGTRKSAPR